MEEFANNANSGRKMVVPDRRLRDTHVTLAHGGGGKAMRNLIQDVFLSSFGSDDTEDQARLQSEALEEPEAKLAFTTDSFVVRPLEFPGGDIGRIAVCGTVNDLAVGGAKPMWLSASFIIEEGLDVDILRRVVTSMTAAAEEAGVKIVTGDTKIVERGSADKLFITTSGVGVIPPRCNLSAKSVCKGDVAIVNGVLGDHGAAILAARGDLALSAEIQSDCQPLGELMEAIFQRAPNIRCARDATRGGLASALNEIAEASSTNILIEETQVPLRKEVKGVCEILGLDPLYLANEGALVVFVPPDEAVDALDAMRSCKAGTESVIIGCVQEGEPGRVEMKTVLGGTRIVDMLVGEQLPRIC
jgi:hydrogenase expression/formation protein HypE